MIETDIDVRERALQMAIDHSGSHLEISTEALLATAEAFAEFLGGETDDLEAFEHECDCIRIAASCGAESIDWVVSPADAFALVDSILAALDEIPIDAYPGLIEE